LTHGLFDNIPLLDIEKAESALHKAAGDLPEEIVKKIFSEESLNKEDEEAMLKIAKTVLVKFQTIPEK
jgi:F0F1-type ATP synthase alpha subunit